MTSVNQTYIICATQRSGSTLLCHYLSNLKFAGFPREHLLPDSVNDFQDPNLSYGETIQKIMEHHCSDNGISGLKIMNNTWADMLAQVRLSSDDPDNSDTELIHKIFPNVKFIFITREKKLRQAISLSKAEYSKDWERHADSQDKQSSFKQLLHPFYLKSALSRVYQREQYWVDYFKSHALPHLHLTYEDLASDPTQTVKQVLDYLEINYPNPLAVNQGSLTKQADIYTEILIFYYHLYFLLYNRLPRRTFSGLRRLKHFILAS